MVRFSKIFRLLYMSCMKVTSADPDEMSDFFVSFLIYNWFANVQF